MIYDNLDEWQVINEVLRNNQAGKSPQQIAAYLGRSTQTVYKWGQDPLASGSEIPKSMMIPFCSFTQDIRLLSWYLFQLDYQPISMKSNRRLSGNYIQEIHRMDEARGRLAQYLIDVLYKQDLSRDDIKKLLEIADEIKDNIQSFMDELRAKL
jgi:hypothetical protein